MANGSAPGEGTKTVVRMSAFERLPWRRIILVALSVGITVFAIWAIVEDAPVRRVLRGRLA